MWILKADDNKAKAYMALLYQHNTRLSFDPSTKLKMNVSKPCAAYYFLTEDKVNEFLTASPKRLIVLHRELEGHINNDDDRRFIKRIFDYDSFIKQNKKMSYALAHLMEVNTCTYCNRQYTLTVDDVDKNGSVVEHLIRPEFDHWFSQKDYPDLALSYYNLIPACHICNSNLKRDKETKLDEHIHPYIDERSGFRFSYVPTSDGYAVDVVREDGIDDNFYKKVKNTLEMFKIPQIYGAHSKLELKELLELAATNHPDYISTLVNEVMAKLGVREEDAYRMLFGIEIMEENYLKRPMSKFKSDIIKKIKEDFGKKS